jgi:hypothetical protein
MARAGRRLPKGHDVSDLIDHGEVVRQLEEAVADLTDDRSRFLAFQRTIRTLPAIVVGNVLLRWADELEEGRGPWTRVAETMGGIPSIFALSAELHQVVLAIGPEGLRHLAASD